jgi:AraC-like DNA-binding protein
MPQRASRSAERYECGTAVWQGDPAPMSHGHSHAEIEINWLAEGSARYLVGNELTTVPSRRLAAFWGGFPHQLLAVEGAVRMSWITLRLPDLLRLAVPASLIDRLLSGRLLVEANAYRPDELLFAQWAEEWRRGAAAQAQVLREVGARLARMARELPPTPPAPVVGGDRLAQVLRILDERVAEPELSLDDVAAAVGVHPKHLATWFKGCTGLGVHAYLTRMRVARAQAMLAAGRDDLLVIALDAGFGSLNRFHANFRSVAGTTPARFRKQMVG